MYMYYASVWIFVSMCTFKGVCVCPMYVHAHVHAHMYTHNTHTYIHTYIQMCTYSAFCTCVVPVLLSAYTNYSQLLFL